MPYFLLPLGARDGLATPVPVSLRNASARAMSMVRSLVFWVG
jgi:hypothetical protein